MDHFNLLLYFQLNLPLIILIHITIQRDNHRQLAHENNNQAILSRNLAIDNIFKDIISILFLTNSMINMKNMIVLFVITIVSSMILTMNPIIKLSNAVIVNQNTIDCNSKQGTANTLAGNFNYGGVKCEGQNGGTASAGAIKSDSNSLSVHGTQGPNDRAHFGGTLRR
ncbi:MAG TPA: hypothetical protein VFX18_03360 [Candidatus Nitrosocosmicus sp.]|nr:hypothetical protein [Candidatus Nitrosocosmicus sp.]